MSEAAKKVRAVACGGMFLSQIRVNGFRGFVPRGAGQRLVRTKLNAARFPSQVQALEAGQAVLRELTGER